MKKIIRPVSVILAAITIFALSVGCSKTYSLSYVQKMTDDLQYYNEKAIHNLDSLIGRNPNEVEDWIYETYDENEIKKAEITNAGAYPSFLSKNETVKIFFILEPDNCRFFIEPNIDKDPAAIYPDFASFAYKQKVKAYCKGKNADYKTPPAICELCLYHFDKADSSTNLDYNYLFIDDGGWGYIGDTGPYASISFVFDKNDFKINTYYIS